MNIYRLRKALRQEKLREARGQRAPAQAKDTKRIKNMVERATKPDGSVDLARLERFARSMAKSIKDWLKAERRGSAAMDLYWDEIGHIFYDRADELSGGVSDSGSDEEGGKSDTVWVLPLGSVNLRNGDNKFFNVLEIWGGDKSHLTVCKNSSGKMIVVTGYGRQGWKRGDRLFLEHDQSRRQIDIVTVVREVSGTMSQDLLNQAARVIGKPSARFYVLK